MRLDIEVSSASQKSDMGLFFCFMRSGWTMRCCYEFWREATSDGDNGHERSWV
jgi:hypothetical protein